MGSGTDASTKPLEHSEPSASLEELAELAASAEHGLPHHLSTLKEGSELSKLDRLQGLWDDSKGGTVEVIGSEGRFSDSGVHPISESAGQLCTRGFTLVKFDEPVATWNGMGMEISWTRKSKLDRLQGLWDDSK